MLSLIQKDDIDEFINYVNQKKISISAPKKITIFETNYIFAKKEKVSLIEYAAFYGSIEIFKYLLNKGQTINSSIWMPAIHGNNLELIHVLENNEIKPNEFLAKSFLKESIKCHHIEITNYILNNYLPSNGTKLSNELALKYFDFLAVQDDLENETTFAHLCKYDYYSLVKLLMNSKEININERIKENNNEIII